MLTKNQRPALTEQDYADLVMYLNDTVPAIQEPKKRRRFEILTRRFDQFQRDIRHERVAREAREVAERALNRRSILQLSLELMT